MSGQDVSGQDVSQDASGRDTSGEQARSRSARGARFFGRPARWLHWIMAALILAMLLLGLRMAATESPLYSIFLDVHRPLGIAILALVAIRIIVRLSNRPPPLPASLPPVQRFAAKASHLALYGLMVAMPLVGWAMLSAAREPIRLYGTWELPPILPHSPALYAGLRGLHTALAYLLLLTFLAHLGAALFHLLIRRDGVFESMVPAAAPRQFQEPTHE